MHGVRGRQEMLLWVSVVGVGLVSLPVRPVRGAYAGVWCDGRLVQLLPAAQVFDTCRTAALAVLGAHLDELERGGPETVVSEGHERRATRHHQRARPVR